MFVKVAGTLYIVVLPDLRYEEPTEDLASMEDPNDISRVNEAKESSVQERRESGTKKERKDRRTGSLQPSKRGLNPNATPKHADLAKSISGLQSVSVTERTFGTKDKDIALALSHQVASATPKCSTDQVRDIQAALTTLSDLAPRDALERLLITQMISVHNLAMEWMSRGLKPDQSPEHSIAKINCATRLMRMFTAQMEALNRHRGHIGHPMVVGNVNVNDGGQAIVGPVSQVPPKNQSAKKSKKDAKNNE
jgi:hypothetical protein